MSAHAARPKHRKLKFSLWCRLGRHVPSPKRPDGFDWYFVTCARCEKYL